MSQSAPLLIILTIVVALTFDFFNGFHDAANSIATVVSTRILCAARDRRRCRMKEPR